MPVTQSDVELTIGIVIFVFGLFMGMLAYFTYKEGVKQ